MIAQIKYLRYTLNLFPQLKKLPNHIFMDDIPNLFYKRLAHHHEFIKKIGEP